MKLQQHLLFACTLSYVLASQAGIALTDEESISELNNTAQVIEIKIDGSNSAAEQADTGEATQYDEPFDTTSSEPAYDSEYEHDAEDIDIEADQVSSSETLQTEIFNQSLPGEEINFKLKQLSTSHYLIDGKSESDIGKMLFKSRLMPSNEVKLSVKLKQKETDDIELIAYFDLANFTMELDGKDAILNQDHKQMLKLSSTHLQSNFEAEYKDYDFPEHALMLVQMMSYWSVSPDGYKHAKRQVESKH